MNWTENAKQKPTESGEYYVINANWSRSAHKCLYLIDENAFVFADADYQKDLPVVVTHWIKFPDFPEEEK